MLKRPLRLDGRLKDRLFPPRRLMPCWPVLGLLALGRRSIPGIEGTAFWFSLFH
jgi:hypothetical protein